MKLNWTERADNRVDEIKAYYKEKSIKAAERIVSDIVAAVEPLKEFPQMAAIDTLLSDLPKSFRSLVVRHIYKIIYYIDESNDTINIVTVWDCRQDNKRLKEEVV